MTEPTTADATLTPKKKQKWVLPIAAAIITISVAGFLISRAGLDKALVKQRLDDTIARVKEKGRAQGRDIDITYGEIDVVGSFARKHVVVHAPTMTVKALDQVKKPEGQPQVESLLITTPSLEIFPEAVDLSALRVEFPQPINFADVSSPDKSLLKVETNTPIAISFAQEAREQVNYSRVRYVSPTEMQLTYLREQQAQGMEDATPELVSVYETLIVNMDANGTIESNVALDKSGLGTGSVNMQNLRMFPKDKPDAKVTIAKITGDWSNTLNAENQNAMTVKFAFGPLEAAPEILPYAPVSFDLDASYSGAMPQSPEAVAAVQSQQSVFALNMLNLSTHDSVLKATGNFTAGASDALPVGKANITLSNLPYVLGELRKYAVLNANNEALVADMLQHITGTPLDQLKDLEIPVERVKDGAFTIGQAKFEELFAIILKHALSQRQGVAPAPVPVPQLPPADKEKTKPIAVPDTGVRG